MCAVSLSWSSGVGTNGSRSIGAGAGVSSAATGSAAGFWGFGSRFFFSARGFCGSAFSARSSRGASGFRSAFSAFGFSARDFSRFLPEGWSSESTGISMSSSRPDCFRVSLTFAGRPKMPNSPGLPISNT